MEKAWSDARPCPDSRSGIRRTLAQLAWPEEQARAAALYPGREVYGLTHFGWRARMEEESPE